MQYKYIVDGEWRHDEHQAFVNGNFGIVNTILVSRESNYIATNPITHIPYGSGMEVDNDTFQRVVCNLVIFLYIYERYTVHVSCFCQLNHDFSDSKL